MINMKTLMTERMKNFYSVGPVQQAAVEDFVVRVIDECCKVVYNAQQHNLPVAAYPSLIREEFNL